MSVKAVPSLEDRLTVVENYMTLARQRNDARGEFLLRRAAKQKAELLRKIQARDAKGI